MSENISHKTKYFNKQNILKKQNISNLIKYTVEVK